MIVAALVALAATSCSEDIVRSAATETTSAVTAASVETTESTTFEDWMESEGYDLSQLSQPSEAEPDSTQAPAPPPTQPQGTKRPTTGSSSAGAIHGRSYWTKKANRWNGYDLDCGEIPIKNIPIAGDDPNGLDGDGDGVGCESY
jgi:hypothetical protein